MIRLSRLMQCSLLASAFILPQLGRTVAEEPADAPPVTKVVLFTSGVGYVEHNGPVDGNAEVDLKFNVQDINDLLKSMVLQDLDGGKISAVTYESKDPVLKTLRTFTIDLTDHPTVAAIVQQVRGEELQIFIGATEKQPAETVTGKIVGVERRPVPAGEHQVIEQDFLNLLTEDGLRSIAWPSISRLKLVDKKLNDELQQALAVLATSHSVDKKSVTLKFQGEGQRNVRVGYIQESPVWRTSYRLVLGEEDEALLQGWAVVENPTEADWDNVKLTLVSGRPISFVMDLYQPLYVQRPTVVPELYSSLVSRTYDQDLGVADADGAALEGAYSRSGMRGRQRNEKSMMGGMGGMAKSGMMPGDAPGAPVPEDRASESQNDPFRPGQGVAAAATAQDVGELFQYEIDEPVTLARRKAAMLPIVNDQVKVEKLSIYNPQTHAKHPLNGAKLTNSTDLHLMQGPITVFDGGVYAGDARIQDLQPGAERLLSYALDLKVEVSQQSEGHPESLIGVKIVKGVLHTTHKLMRQQNYIIKNSGNKPRKVLIEQPLDPHWTLVEPAKPEEKTRDMYRFAVEVPASESLELPVREEHQTMRTVAVASMGDDDIVLFIKSNKIKPELAEALQNIIQQRGEVSSLQQQEAKLQGEIQTIEQDQSRLRQNINAINRNSDLYARYIETFTKQEDEIEKTRESLKELQLSREEAEAKLADYINNLNLE